MILVQAQHQQGSPWYDLAAFPTLREAWLWARNLTQCEDYRLLRRAADGTITEVPEGDWPME